MLVRTINHIFNVQAMVRLEGSSNLIATASSTDIKIWNILTGDQVKVFKGGNTKSLASIQSNSDLLASGNLIGTVYILNITSGDLVFEFKGHTTQVSVLTGLKENLLASGSNDIRIWNLTSGEIKFKFDKTNGGHSGYTRVLTLFEDHYLASSGIGDTDINLWDLREGTLKHKANLSIGGHCQSISVLTSLGNDLLASGADRGSGSGCLDGSVKIWKFFN
jgi:WD40 repeat protein